MNNIDEKEKLKFLDTYKKYLGVQTLSIQQTVEAAQVYALFIALNLNPYTTHIYELMLRISNSYLHNEPSTNFILDYLKNKDNIPYILKKADISELLNKMDPKQKDLIHTIFKKLEKTPDKLTDIMLTKLNMIGPKYNIMPLSDTKPETFKIWSIQFIERAKYNLTTTDRVDLAYVIRLGIHFNCFIDIYRADDFMKDLNFTIEQIAICKHMGNRDICSKCNYDELYQLKEATNA